MNDMFHIIYVFERSTNISVSLYIPVHVLNVLLPKALSVWFLFNAAASSTAPSWLIWLFLRSRACNASLDPTPSQNMAKELSNIPKAFHSKHKLRKKICIR